MKSSGIGGQAVIEGVMMKNQDVYSVAVRKPDGTIEIKEEHYQGAGKKHFFARLPIIRGIVAFIESMAIGMKTLTYSASFYEEEAEKPGKVEETLGKVFKERAEAVAVALTVCASVLLAVGIFMILPFFIAELFQKYTDSSFALALLEGGIRIGIFIVYVAGISLMKDIKRVFMYHGAEHKTINCVESGKELTVANVRTCSKHHRRCGTSFMLIVMVVSILFFLFIRVDNVWLRMVCRVLLVPVIAGVSYEFIRLAGKSESKIIGFFSKPGMWLQALTTREPDDSMIEVAIASVEAVFDWRAFQREAEKEARRRGPKPIRREEEKAAPAEPSKEEEAPEEDRAGLEEVASLPEEPAAEEEAVLEEAALEREPVPFELVSFPKWQEQEEAASSMEGHEKLAQEEAGSGEPQPLEAEAEKPGQEEQEARAERPEEKEPRQERPQMPEVKIKSVRKVVDIEEARKARRKREKQLADIERTTFRVEVQEEEEDEILKALDRFFVFHENEDDPQ